MEKRWCTSCGKSFEPRPQSPRQSYCTDSACQQARRRLWQKTKRRSDADYVKNQANAQHAWVERNPDYWRAYRQSHPEYTSRNRAKQLARNQRRAPREIAKSDASTPELPLTGIYTLMPVDPGLIAKIGTLTVRLTLLRSSP